ncbi:MAG: Mu transposase C-terminal domain-containing protein [Clostridiales bacterium]|jgi:hypothetical protein|nr:Mu transposase C-terminal domain-containing protein [Clostridiales bacterium]
MIRVPSINDLVRFDGGSALRILWISPGRKEVVLFNVDTMAMPFVKNYSEIIRGLEEDVYKYVDDDLYIDIHNENSLTENQKNSRDAIWKIMEIVVADEPRIYDVHERSSILKECSKRSKKSPPLLYRYLKMYWLHGKSPNAFIPKFYLRGGPGKERTPGEAMLGRPRIYKHETERINITEDIKALFRLEVGEDHTLLDSSLQVVYDTIIQNHFTAYTYVDDASDVPKTVKQNLASPTIEQFKYWFKKEYSPKEKLERKFGERGYNLNCRPILGASDTNISGPGMEFQIDATLGDANLVSRHNRNDILGRIVLYLIVDVYSRLIVGFYAGLEGPSWAGAMKAIVNTGMDKVLLCAKYGIEIKHTDWPSQHMPIKISADRGEMLCGNAKMLQMLLNVAVDNKPPFRADLKGIVERAFGVINTCFINYLPGHVKKKGLPPERGEKDTRLEAQLNIDEINKLMILAILSVNSRTIEGFVRSKDMIENNINAIPLELWNWGSDNMPSTRNFDINRIKLAVMPTESAKVHREGITLFRLNYYCDKALEEGWFETAATSPFDINVSYDPSNLSRIYIINPDSTYEICYLTEKYAVYKDKTLDELQAIRRSEAQGKVSNAVTAQESKSLLRETQSNLESKAKQEQKEKGKPKTASEQLSGIRDNRRVEREELRKEEAFILGEDTSNTDPSEITESSSDGTGTATVPPEIAESSSSGAGKPDELWIFKELRDERKNNNNNK